MCYGHDFYVFLPFSDLVTKEKLPNTESKLRKQCLLKLTRRYGYFCICLSFIWYRVIVMYINSIYNNIFLEIYLIWCDSQSKRNNINFLPIKYFFVGQLTFKFGQIPAASMHRFLGLDCCNGSLHNSLNTGPWVKRLETFGVKLTELWKRFFHFQNTEFFLYKRRVTWYIFDRVFHW